MNWVAVDSTNLSAVAYDPIRAFLYIRFGHGGEYEYSGVPPSVHSGLMNASSKGQYFNTYIKDKYSTRRL